jgi:hypothetical protein
MGSGLDGLMGRSLVMQDNKKHHPLSLLAWGLCTDHLRKLGHFLWLLARILMEFQGYHLGGTVILEVVYLQTHPGQLN